METKNIIIIVALVALIGGIGAWVLLGGKKGVEEGVTPPVEEAVTPEEEAELSLTDILAKAGSIASVKYDTVITAPGKAAVTTKMWFKEQKMRMEGTLEGQDVVYLIDMNEQVSYVYTPAQNMAVKMDFSKAQETVGESPTEQPESVMKYNPVTLGTEVLDGKSCLIIEYTTETEKTKSWVWIRHGLLIRVESTTAEGTSIVELKNIEFVDIADSTFELPAGVQIMELPFGF